MKRVLDVGNCDMDHGSICRLLEPLQVEIVRAHQADEAQQLLGEGRFDLVLVNRIFDRDGDGGIEFIRGLQSNDNPPSVMLISNFAESQEQAVAAGALPGFGKSQLQEPATLEKISQALSADANC